MHISVISKSFKVLVYMYIKGGYLDFSHLTKLKYIYLSLKFIWKKYINHQELKIIKLPKNKVFDGGSLKRLRSILSYF